LHAWQAADSSIAGASESEADGAQSRERHHPTLHSNEQFPIGFPFHVEAAAMDVRAFGMQHLAFEPLAQMLRLIIDDLGFKPLRPPPPTRICTISSPSATRAPLAGFTTILLLPAALPLG
jgi:hypothetical protein